MLCLELTNRAQRHAWSNVAPDMNRRVARSVFLEGEGGELQPDFQAE